MRAEATSLHQQCTAAVLPVGESGQEQAAAGWEEVVGRSSRQEVGSTARQGVDSWVAGQEVVGTLVEGKVAAMEQSEVGTSEVLGSIVQAWEADCTEAVLRQQAAVVGAWVGPIRAQVLGEYRQYEGFEQQA